jgi:hypothetical protein
MGSSTSISPESPVLVVLDKISSVLPELEQPAKANAKIMSNMAGIIIKREENNRNFLRLPIIFRKCFIFSPFLSVLA